MKIYKLIVLTLGILLLIPAQAQLLDYPIDTINGTAVYRYRVEKSIGLWRISRNFEISQEEIIKWNPFLRERGLRYDETLLIPVKQRAIPQEVQAVQPVLEPQPAPVEEEPVFVPVVEPVILEDEPAAPEQEQIIVDTLEPDTSLVRIGILLPIQAEVIKRDRFMDRFYDFYTGALIALYEAQQRGQRYELFTYDIGKSDIRLQQLIDSTALDNLDAIIGPVYNSQVQLVTQWAQTHKPYILIPFSSSVPNINRTPTLLQFNPSAQSEASVMAEYLASRGDSVRCLFIKADEDDIPQSVKWMQQAIRQRRVPVAYTTVHQILADSLVYDLADSVENIILFNTERFSNLKAVMPYMLDAIRQGKQLTLLSRYAWQNETIILPQLYVSNMTAHPEWQETAYAAAWNHYFHHSRADELPYYDLLGYDITRHLLSVLPYLRHADASIADSILAREYQGIQSAIRYLRTDSLGGYENQNLHIIRQ